MNNNDQPAALPVREARNRAHVLRLAHRIGDVACGNEGVVDHAHKVETCHVCGRIADMLIDFFTPDPEMLPVREAPQEASLHELFSELEIALYGKAGNTWEVGRLSAVMDVLRHAQSGSPTTGSEPPQDAKDKPMELLKGLRAYLDSQVINGDTIGSIRRDCFMPWDCFWNGIVRDETAKRERRPPGSEPTLKRRIKRED